MTQSGTFGLMRLAIAFAVGYALTGSVAIAAAVTWLDPIVSAVVQYLSDP